MAATDKKGVNSFASHSLAMFYPARLGQTSAQQFGYVECGFYCFSLSIYRNLLLLSLCLYSAFCPHYE